MAKIVSEKREPISRPSTPLPANTTEATSSPMASMLGLVLTALFILGAVAIVLMAFQS